MPEIYSKLYTPIGEATFGHVVLREGLVPDTALVVDTPYVSNAMTANFQGLSRQSFKIIPIHAGGGAPTVDFEIQEFLPDVGQPNDGDPANGTWATKSSLGTASIAINVIGEHHSEDVLRLARIQVTPRVAVPDGGIKFELGGRRDT